MPKGPVTLPHNIAVRLSPAQFEALHETQRPGERMSDTLRRIVDEYHAALVEAERTGVPNSWSRVVEQNAQKNVEKETAT